MAIPPATACETDVNVLRERVAALTQQRDEWKAFGERNNEAWNTAIRDIARMREEMNAIEKQRDGLVNAAQAMIDRWDAPLWKDVPSTAEFIGGLRASVAKAKPTPQPSPSTS